MPQGRADWATLIASVLVAVAVCVWTLLYASSGPPWPSLAVTSGADSRNDTTMAEEASALDGEGMLALGETFVGAGTATTVLQVRKLAPEWIGVRAKRCIHADATASEDPTLASWVVEDDQGRRYLGVESPWGSFPAQQFPTTTIRPGDCIRGWVTTNVPREAIESIETVTFGASGAVWTLSELPSA